MTDTELANPTARRRSPDHPVVFLLLTLWLQTACAKDVIFYDGFEDQAHTLEAWRASGNQRLERVQTPTRDGSFSLRSRVDRLEDAVGYRTELALRTPQRFDLGEEYWFGLSVLVPADAQFDPVPEVVAQWHATPDKHLGEVSRAPPLALLIRDSSWIVSTRWDDRVVTPGRLSANAQRYKESGWLKVGSVQRGQWTDWVFHVRWSYQPNGFLEVWRDGTKVVGRTGPNTFNDAAGPYLKIGLYKSAWNVKSRVYDDSMLLTERQIFHDAVRVGDSDSSYEEVRPR